MSTLLKMTVTARPDPFSGEGSRGFLAKKIFEGKTLEEISEKFSAWRDENGFGASRIGGKNVVKRGRKKVARISYNGRVWPV